MTFSIFKAKFKFVPCSKEKGYIVYLCTMSVSIWWEYTNMAMFPLIDFIYAMVFTIL